MGNPFTKVTPADVWEEILADYPLRLDKSKLTDSCKKTLRCCFLAYCSDPENWTIETLNDIASGLKLPPVKPNEYIGQILLDMFSYGQALLDKKRRVLRRRLGVCYGLLFIILTGACSVCFFSWQTHKEADNQWRLWLSFALLGLEGQMLCQAIIMCSARCNCRRGGTSWTICGAVLVLTGCILTAAFFEEYAYTFRGICSGLVGNVMGLLARHLLKDD